MKCYACGFNDSQDGDFYKVFVAIPYTDYDTEIRVQGEEETVEGIIYACPKCGALKIKSDAEETE
jgi:predicted RNA-binding Zn-ribbon protein involved in translation (DUF1610 family)